MRNTAKHRAMTFAGEIVALRFENVFNPYVDACPDHDERDAADIRRRNLEIVLGAALERDIDFLFGSHATLATEGGVARGSRSRMNCIYLGMPRCLALLPLLGRPKGRRSSAYCNGRLADAACNSPSHLSLECLSAAPSYARRPNVEPNSHARGTDSVSATPNLVVGEPSAALRCRNWPRCSSRPRRPWGPRCCCETSSYGGQAEFVASLTAHYGLPEQRETQSNRLV